MTAFDRILGDILDFIRRFLWWKTDKKTIKRQPFVVVQKPMQGPQGQLSLVIGRDTPRAARTWIFSPTVTDVNTLADLQAARLDIHIYLDFLGPLPNAPDSQKKHWELSQRSADQRGEAFLTHRIQILQASRILNEHGFYDYELLFWKDYDFYRANAGDPERWAIATVDRIARQLLTTTNLNWEADIEATRQFVLGAYQPRSNPLSKRPLV
jgi:hypothetical protein